MSAAALAGTLRDGAHSWALRVYYEDTDAGGVVYYANYLKFAERARTEMLRCLGIEQERLRAATGTMLVVRRCAAEFLAPARLDDDLLIVTRLVRQAGAAVDLEQEVRRGDALLVRLESRIACIGAAGRPVRPPPELAAALASLAPPDNRMVPAHA